MAQVSFIIIHSTGLAPFPRLSAPPHSSHTPIAPRRPGGTHETALYSPPPLSRGEPVRAAAAYLGVRTDEARERRRRRGVRSDRDERGERGKKKISVRFPDTLPLGPQPAERFTRDAMRWYWTFGGRPDAHPPPGGRRWLLRSRAAGSGSPFLLLPKTWRMAAGFGLQANGATPPLPLGRQHPSSTQEHGSESRPTCSSFAPAPPLRAATGGLRHFCCPIFSAPRSTQQRGLSDSVSLLPPGLRHQCNDVDRYGKKEAGTGEHLRTFTNNKNKHNRKAAAPHGRLPHKKHKVKSRPGPSLVFQCRHSSFIPSEAPPWDSRTGEWRRCRSLSFLTGLAPFPRLSAPPHSSQYAT